MITQYKLPSDDEVLAYAKKRWSGFRILDAIPGPGEIEWMRQRAVIPIFAVDLHLRSYFGNFYNVEYTVTSHDY